MTTITKIASAQDILGSQTVDAISSVAVAAHECIVVLVANSTQRTVTAIGDNGAGASTNIYTKLIEDVSFNGAAIFYCLDPAAVPSGRTFRATISANDSAKNIFVYKLDALGTVLDSNKATGSSTTPSVSTTISIDVGKAMFGLLSERNADPINPGGIWTSDYAAQNNGKGQAFAHGLTTGSGTVTYNPTISGSAKSFEVLIAAFSATPPTINGTASITEAADTASSTATLTLQATASITEAGDTASSAGTLKLQASAAPSEANDTLVAAGLYPPRLADLSVTEQGDTVISSGGAHPIQADAAITEAADTSSSTASLKIQADAVLLEASDTVASTAFVPLSLATLNIDEESDTLVSASRVRPPQRLPQGPPFDADYGANTDGFYGKYYG